jgi:hypothetical protein
MSIMELGALGEFVGAFAVVVTLGYLAVQVRHSKTALETNSQETRAATRQAILESEMFFQSQILSCAGTWEKVVVGEPLEDREEMRKGIVLYNMLMTQYENRYHQYRSGYLDAMPDIQLTVGFPIYENWRLSGGATSRSPDFLEYIDGLRNRVPAS